MKKYIPTFEQYLNESNNLNESLIADLLLENLGAMSGMPKSLVKSLVKSGAGQNSTYMTDVKGGKNLRKVLKHLDDKENIALIAKTPTGEFAYALKKNDYDYGKGKGLTFYVDDQLQELLNMNSGEMKNVKDNIFTQYEYKYPKYKWRGGRNVKWSGGYYEEHQRMTASNLKEWLPLGDFDLSVIQVDPERAEKRKLRSDLKAQPGPTTGVTYNTVKKYVKDKYFKETEKYIKMFSDELKNIVSDINSDDLEDLSLKIKNIESYLDFLKTQVDKMKSFDNQLKFNSFISKENGLKLSDAIKSNRDDSYWKREYQQLIDVLKGGVNENLNENLNDPILVAVRAAKDKYKKMKADDALRRSKRVYGKQREKLEDELESINQEVKDLRYELDDLFQDMEAEAGQKEDWNDNDANRYGTQMNEIQEKIEKLIIKRNKIETKLSY